jgi:hypothetical protein
MKNKVFLLLIFSAFFSCDQNKNQASDHPLPSTKNDSLKIEKQADSTARILLAGKDTLVFKLKIDSANQHITVPLKINSGDTLFATLYSKDKKANIRISQIGFPDSTFDGPFGRELNYKIKDTGNYKIIIGENMMAGDRWNGDFTLEAWVK